MTLFRMRLIDRIDGVFEVHNNLEYSAAHDLAKARLDDWCEGDDRVVPFPSHADTNYHIIYRGGDDADIFAKVDAMPKR